MTYDRAALIGLDWGSSRVRAYRFDDRGNVTKTTSRPWGVLTAARADFAAAYAELTAGWLAPGDTAAIACGMIGSTEGWLAAPYCACPAGLDELAGALVELPAPAGSIAIVPGVEVRGVAPDMMRGEETQVAGALSLRPDLAAEATLVLPGTHAKWVTVRAGAIAKFTTFMTGELFALLSEHSILGRPARRIVANDAPGAQHAAAAEAAFDCGVVTARDCAPAGIAPLLFRTRALGLAGRLDAHASLEFLSGLLIGDEVRAGLAGAVVPLALVGDVALCARYARVLDAFGVAATVVADAAPVGLFAIARRAGLVAEPVSRA